jgi:hypothetical protein
MSLLPIDSFVWLIVAVVVAFSSMEFHAVVALDSLPTDEWTTRRVVVLRLIIHWQPSHRDD